MDTNGAIKKVIKEFGSREGFLVYQIMTLTMTNQPCDITFFKKGPEVDVKITSQIMLALMYGMGAKKLKEMLENITLSNGNVININEIWVINPMPAGGITKEELNEVDMSKGEAQFGPKGETIREMIRATYHCKSKVDEDYFVRRFLAS